MSGHTPGPWTLREPNGPGMGFEIREIGAWFGRDTLSEQMLANVQLCAAAPDLLEALEEIVSAVDEADELHESGVAIDWQIVVRAKALIAKARGEK